MTARPSIDLREDENQLLLIGLAMAESIRCDDGAACGALLEKLAGEGAKEFRAFVREDLLAHAERVIDAAIALAVVNWIDAPPYVEPIFDLLKFSVRCDLADFEDRSDQYYKRRAVERAGDQRELAFDGGAEQAKFEEERLEWEGAAVE
jgi:hypothetical protein